MSKRYPGGIIRKTPQTPSQTSAQGVWDMTSVTQAVKENTWPIAGVPDPISKSLRFRYSASSFLNRTAGTPTDNLKWTWSAWVKRGQLSSLQNLFEGYSTASNWTLLFFNTDNTLYFYNVVSGIDWDFTTTAVFRDPSAWYHIVLVYDSANATAANRVIIYVNGVSQAGSSPSGQTPQNQASYINAASAIQNIGKRTDGPYYFDGYMADVYFIDGQALTPSSFGSTNDQTGVWQPIAYTGTYGTNGFYLPFSNTASTTTLGYDYSGNSNNWTTNNISLTSGSTYDSMVDVPTQWIPYNTAGDTGALWRGNYAVLNSINKGTTTTLSNANLNFANSAGTDGLALSTIGVSSGKWYCEVTALGSDCMVGITSNPAASGSYVGALSTGYGYYQTGSKYNNGSATSYGSSYTTNDVIGIALDLDAGTLVFYKNNVSQGTAFSSLSGTFFFAVGNGSVNSLGAINFGQRPFSYTPPSGFKTLCTTNLPTPTIGTTSTTQANKYFDATTYTGTGLTDNTITNSGSMQPDMLWIKSRSLGAGGNHMLVDSVRGIGSGTSTKEIYPNLTNAESGTGSVLSFNSNGFSLHGESGAERFNSSGATYVGWQWRANGAGVTNTAGTITSTVSANTTAGFSIVTYTGNGTSGATVGHGLGVAPSMTIIKRRNATQFWIVWHSSLAGATSNLYLNATDSVQTDSNFTALPSSTVLTLNSDRSVNISAQTYVAYCFAQVAGYSAFGSYTGNGSSDGPFIYTGFKPAFVMVRSTSSPRRWVMFDDARFPNNGPNMPTLNANLSDAESTNTENYGDFLSNGFKCRATNGNFNGSGETYIYMMFAESPFKFSLAR